MVRPKQVSWMPCNNVSMGLRVECLLKTESGYLRDAEVTSDMVKVILLEIVTWKKKNMTGLLVVLLLS